MEWTDDENEQRSHRTTQFDGPRHSRQQSTSHQIKQVHGSFTCEHLQSVLAYTLGYEFLVLDQRFPSAPFTFFP